MKKLCSNTVLKISSRSIVLNIHGWRVGTTQPVVATPLAVHSRRNRRLLSSPRNKRGRLIAPLGSSTVILASPSRSAPTVARNVSPECPIVP